MISTPLKNMTSSVGMIIPNIWKKTCSKPSTSIRLIHQPPTHPICCLPSGNGGWQPCTDLWHAAENVCQVGCFQRHLQTHREIEFWSAWRSQTIVFNQQQKGGSTYKNQDFTQKNSDSTSKIWDQVVAPGVHRKILWLCRHSQTFIDQYGQWQL